jgi:hypothetical protein
MSVLSSSQSRFGCYCRNEQVRWKTDTGALPAVDAGLGAIAEMSR